MTRPVGVYVHFPYCITRCTYCDFNTYRMPEAPGTVDAYVDALLREGDTRAPRWAGRTLGTVYFGGGTPSLMGAPAVRRVLDGVARWFCRRTSSVEVTLECNPAEATPALFAAYRDAGITRLSLGVQSLRAPLLQSLARRHDPARALAALRGALRAGFDSVSADVMFGLPGQPVSAFVEDLTTIADTGVPHVSVYHLTLESGTAMTRDVTAGRVQLPDEDAQADMWDAIVPTLAPYGLEPYEVSNLARPGHESRHNTAYWQGVPYLGLGAGAHGLHVPDDWAAAGASAERTANRKHHSAYVSEVTRNGHAVESSERLGAEEHLRERMFTGLRHLAGVDLPALAQELGVDPAERFRETIAGLVEEDLCRLAAGRLALTPRGLRFGDVVFGRFF